MMAIFRPIDRAAHARVGKRSLAAAIANDDPFNERLGKAEVVRERYCSADKTAKTRAGVRHSNT